MTITLDAATEQRIQRELARGNYRDPAELISHALDLVAAEEDWLLRNRDVINRDLDESFAQSERGEGFAEEDLRARMVARRGAHRGAQTA